MEGFPMSGLKPFSLDTSVSKDFLWRGEILGHGIPGERERLTFFRCCDEDLWRRWSQGRSCTNRM